MAHIGINTSKAREIHKDRIRIARKPLLEAKDVEYMRAQEAGTDTVGIVSDKQALRDATNVADTAVITGTTVDEVSSQLKVNWDTDLLGETPFL